MCHFNAPCLRTRAPRCPPCRPPFAQRAAAILARLRPARRRQRANRRPRKLSCRRRRRCRRRHHCCCCRRRPPLLLPPLLLRQLNDQVAPQKILWGKHEVSTAKYSVCLGQGHQLSWSRCGHMRGQTASRQQRLTSQRLTFDAQTLDLDASHPSSSLTPRHTRQNILQPRRQRLLQALASCSTRILDMNA